MKHGRYTRRSQGSQLLLPDNLRYREDLLEKLFDPLFHVGHHVSDCQKLE